MVKSTNWFFKKKRALQETNGLDIGPRLQIFVFWFCYRARVVVETSGRTSVPNSNLSTPGAILLLSLALF